MPSTRSNVRVVKWALALVVAVGVVWEVRRGVLAYRAESLTFAPPRGRVTLPPDAAALRITRVTFPSKDGVMLSGWYIPSRDRSGILLAHGTDATRATLLGEARILSADGHGVLLFDFPGHGESKGSVQFGVPARNAVEGAVAFLASRPEIDPQRIGALGFSDGGVAVADAAVVDQRIRATALVAVPGNAKRQTIGEYQTFGPVAVLGAELAYDVKGVQLDHMNAESDAAAISPRALAVFGGKEDGVVHLDEALDIYAAARAPKQLFVVQHGGHGDYAEKDTAYARELRGFFANALRDRKTP